MDVINRSLSVLFTIILLAAFENSFAQSEAPFYFNKPITLDSLTKYVHSRSKLRFSFNSTKVKGTQLIDLKKGAYTINQLLQQIRKNTSLYYAMRNGYVIFQDNPPKQKTTPPTVTKPATPKPPKPKATTKPALQLQPVPVIKTTPTDTTKIKTDSTHLPDSIKVLLPILPRVKNKEKEEEEKEEKEKLSGRFNFSFGRKLIDTTIIDTLQKKDTLTVKKKERTTRTTAPARVVYDDVGTTWSWQYGLQWKATLPFNGSKYYVNGANARSEPYNLLIPGIWLSTTVNNRHELMLLVKPAEWYFYNNKVFRKDTSHVIDNSDSIPKTIYSRKTTTLIKTGGWYGSLQYNYHINEHWLIGAGVGYHLRVRGLARQQSFKNLSDTLAKDTLYSMEKGAETDKYLASSFITGKLEVAYHFNALDVGATFMMPLTAPFKDISLNKSRPLNVQLFVRWRIKRNEDE
ncbi:STN domain-containing protein [Niastella sp. OAS944]|uniref:STN domain-containing protein n=1 Tax=Niastella sp. OAS944 TaxID=2664089 RepID=UPI003496C51C|nr:hypothetical protein [Chitinophagaceae bacterium OAS944]